MAPRKKKDPEKRQTASGALKAKDAGVKRRTRSSGLPPEYTGLEQLPKTPKVGVKRYKNGLVNLTKTPKHLLERAQRNATESPLLRLPSEIRSVIWNLAVGVDLVYINRKVGRPLRATGWALAFNAQSTHFTNDRQLSAFHLPEVCRQIYAETATLAYSTNTFLLCSHDPYWLRWIRVLSLTQREAITSIELRDLYEYLRDFRLRQGVGSLKGKGLVGLTHFHVSIAAQESAKEDINNGVHGKFLELSKDRQSWVHLVTDAVKLKEGQDMLVEVE